MVVEGGGGRGEEEGVGEGMGGRACDRLPDKVASDRHESEFSKDKVQVHMGPRTPPITTQGRAECGAPLSL